MERENGKYYIPLVALWAFVESGLGGMMHAMHLPFTGIFLGGFAVISISLIGHFEERPFSQILKATMIVMLLKASVNPLTSPMAYIAVGFQGLLGAVLFRLKSASSLVPLIFAFLSMIESAIQKFLVLTILFGTAWFKAIDKFSHSVLKSLGLKDDVPFALTIVSLYIGLYCIWGLVLGIWIHKIPGQIEKRRHLYDNLKPELPIESEKKLKNKKKFKGLSIIAALIFLSCFLIPDKNPWVESLTLILRTASIVVIWFLLILPLWKKALARLKRKKYEETPLVIARMENLKNEVKPLYKLISLQYKGIRKWKEFVLGLLVIGLKEK